jgi:hypothetical protein
MKPIHMGEPMAMKNTRTLQAWRQSVVNDDNRNKRRLHNISFAYRDVSRPRSATLDDAESLLFY